MLLGIKAVYLDLRIFSDVMFFAGTDEKKRDTADQKTGPEENGAHADGTVVVNVSGVQLKLRVFPTSVGIELKAALAGLLSPRWAAQRKTARGMKCLRSFFSESGRCCFWR